MERVNLQDFLSSNNRNGVMQIIYNDILLFIYVVGIDNIDYLFEHIELNAR